MLSSAGCWQASERGRVTIFLDGFGLEPDGKGGTIPEQVAVRAENIVDIDDNGEADTPGLQSLAFLPRGTVLGAVYTDLLLHYIREPESNAGVQFESLSYAYQKLYFGQGLTRGPFANVLSGQAGIGKLCAGIKLLLQQSPVAPLQMEQIRHVRHPFYVACPRPFGDHLPQRRKPPCPCIGCNSPVLD